MSHVLSMYLAFVPNCHRLQVCGALFSLDWIESTRRFSPLLQAGISDLSISHDGECLATPGTGNDIDIMCATFILFLFSFLGVDSESSSFC